MISSMTRTRRAIAVAALLVVSFAHAQAALQFHQLAPHVEVWFGTGDDHQVNAAIILFSDVALGDTILSQARPRRIFGSGVLMTCVEDRFGGISMENTLLIDRRSYVVSLDATYVMWHLVEQFLAKTPGTHDAAMSLLTFCGPGDDTVFDTLVLSLPIDAEGAAVYRLGPRNHLGLVTLYLDRRTSDLTVEFQPF